MPLNISKGNMYPFVTHTWNTIKGICPHDCSYCYMKQFKQNDIRFDEKEFKTDLGKDNYIFVGSSCDMWADVISEEWIVDTLVWCNRFFTNKYLYQSKNPRRIIDFQNYLSPKSVLGTTIETNRHYPEMGKTPPVIERASALNLLSQYFPTMVTVEPIIDFDLDILVDRVKMCNPEWVNIGADSKGHKLPEPGPDKIKELIRNLKVDGIEVKIKDNLKRLM